MSKFTLIRIAHPNILMKDDQLRCRCDRLCYELTVEKNRELIQHSQKSVMKEGKRMRSPLQPHQGNRMDHAQVKFGSNMGNAMGKENFSVQ